MGDDADVLESAEAKAEEDTPPTEEKKTGRKLYKGETKTVKQLLADFKGPVPIQPVKRRYTIQNGYTQELPPSFVVTKFAPGWGGRFMMHYYRPKSGEKSYREVPEDLELNVLTGKRSDELRAEFDTAVKTNLSRLSRRIACNIGTDPEIFAVDKTGAILPAWTYLGSKDKPTPYVSKCGYFKGVTYWDGFQAEMTTPNNLTCLAQMSDSVHAGLKKIHEEAHRKGGKLTVDSVLPVNPDFLQKQAPEHVQFGCAPSFNLYGLKGNTQEGRDVPYRFAGGHIHFGLHQHQVGGKMAPEAILRIVKGLDTVLAVACVSMFASLDNPIRRQFYGQVGEYRLPAHGLEYRVLSNAWLAHPLVLNMTFDLARAVAGAADDEVLGVWNATPEETMETVMNHDVDRARDILTRNKDVFQEILKLIGGHYNSGDSVAIAYQAWLGGMDSFVEKPRDIANNWRLDGTWVMHCDGPGANWGRAWPELARKRKV